MDDDLELTPVHESVAALGTILSLWAHPDDETFLAGGVMAAARDLGQRVVCVSLTSGERGTDDPVRWPPDRLGRLRRWEAKAAMAILGVDEHRTLGLPDGGLADLDPEDGVDLICGLIDDVRPDTILTFGPDGMTFHPDHRTTGAWVVTAWDRRGRHGQVLQATHTAAHLARFGPSYEAWGIYMTQERPIGLHPHELALSFVLSGPALDRKLAALDAMASQTRAAVAAIGRDVFAADVAMEAFRRYRRGGNVGAVLPGRASTSTVNPLAVHR